VLVAADQHPLQETRVVAEAAQQDVLQSAGSCDGLLTALSCLHVTP
jgi:hypothetical protein